MFVLFKKDYISDIICHEHEDSCIQYAVKDLQNDLKKISGKSPKIKTHLSSHEKGSIFIGSAKNKRFADLLRQMHIDIAGLQGKWEHYQIKTIGNSLVICGSDKRGTMWGIYELCEKYLNVDPLYHWTCNEPCKGEELILNDLDVFDGPKSFKYRGWFINDEDLLTEWLDGGGQRKTDYSFYHQVIHESVLDKILETALRLKQNLIIPASLLDIENKAEERLVKQVVKRGLFISQHHIEPLGVSHFAWESYWAKRNLNPEPSYAVNPDKFEEIWTHYAKRWAQYDGVIWQLGLRGKGDKPVWKSVDNFPVEMKARGKVISSAIAKQKKIVADALGHEDFVATTTIYMEGVELYEKGYLVFPKGTMIVFSDDGLTQMWQNSFYSIKRDEAKSYGLYYHLAFWWDGPHLAQGNPPSKILYNYKTAAKRHRNDYSIVNVSNVREFVLGIDMLSKITWNVDNFKTDDFIRQWCAKQFGGQGAEHIPQLYEAFFDGFYELENKLIPYQVLAVDGLVKMVGLRLIGIMKGEPVLDHRYTRFDSDIDFFNYYKNATQHSLIKWGRLYSNALNSLTFIDSRRKQFFTDNFIVQLEILMGLYNWVYYLCIAALAMQKQNGKEKFKAAVKKSVYSLEQLIENRKKAEHGKWRNWYKGDTKINVNQLLNKTKGLSFNGLR